MHIFWYSVHIQAERQLIEPCVSHDMVSICIPHADRRSKGSWLSDCASKKGCQMSQEIAGLLVLDAFPTVHLLAS